VTATLLETPLHDWHAAHGARLVDFAGWSMPVQYTSIVAEHNAVRNAAGLFDVSHMGRLRFTGERAAEFLDCLVTRRVTDMQPGQVRYALITNDIGGIIDDVLVYHLPAGQLTGGASMPTFLMVVNASNREKVLCWIDAKKCNQSGVEVNDVTEELAMIAVQGPKALELAQPLVDADLAAMKYYHGRHAKVDRQPAIVSRTGYTGEDGVEIMITSDRAAALWEKILERGKSCGAMACGLGSRDTLRLEAAMPLYGHELNEQITPWQAGLDFAVNLEGREFTGRTVLAKMKLAVPKQVRVGLELLGKRVPREHYPILGGDKQVGEVTSGTFSPTLNKPIAMGYVALAHAAPGAELVIDIRGSKELAHVVKLPFYKRKKAG
jgi:glycine cleavage system T protein (aminomethyltransferase)